jgi:hypothetical protein
LYNVVGLNLTTGSIELTNVEKSDIIPKVWDDTNKDIKVSCAECPWFKRHDPRHAMGRKKEGDATGTFYNPTVEVLSAESIFPKDINFGENDRG